MKHIRKNKNRHLFQTGNLKLTMIGDQPMKIFKVKSKAVRLLIYGCRYD